MLLLQARTWVLFVIAGASREQGTALLKSVLSPDHDNFWLGLIPGIPAVLAFLLSRMSGLHCLAPGVSISVAVGAGGFTLLATVAVAERWIR